MNNGIEAIFRERLRQIEVLGFFVEHDNQHDNRELEKAGDAYLLRDVRFYPWEKEEFIKNRDDPVDAILKCLIKAGALYLAEESRLKRRNDLDYTFLNKKVTLCIQLIDSIFEIRDKQ